MIARNPRDKEVLRAEAAALEARGESLSFSGDAQSSVASLQAAVNTYDRMIQLPGTTAPHIFEAAIANVTLGNELSEDTGMSDAVAGTAAYRRTLAMDEQALKIDPNYMAVRRGIPLMHVHLGNNVLDTDPAQALAEFQLAASLQAALPKRNARSIRRSDSTLFCCGNRPKRTASSAITPLRICCFNRRR